MAESTVLLITPVRNEAAHIGRVARAVSAQTKPPDVWLVVDDSSTDDTPELLAELTAEITFLKVLAAPPAPAPTNGGRDRLGLAAEARAFNWARGQVRLAAYDYIGKLDGDIELCDDYLERLIARLEDDRELGIAGGTIVEASGGRWRRVRIPSYHVHGAVKMYSRQCFEAVGGIQERLGWDTIDETYARMRGYRTATFEDLVVRHHRPSATADGVLRGRARHGQCAYIVRYSPLWVMLRSVKVAASRPFGISGVAFLYGYFAAALRRVPRVEDRAFKRFVRGELRARLRPSLARAGRV